MSKEKSEAVEQRRGGRLAVRCLRLAGIYLICGMSMGIFIGLAH
jgi:hypothetical protein